MGFRNRIVWATVGSILLFNYGFMLIRVPPGIPVGELVLILALLSSNLPLLLSRFGTAVSILPFLLWWGEILRAFYDASAYGIWSLRDATHIFESMFILIGFQFANVHPERIFQLLPRLLFFGFLYGLTYPLRDLLINFSPKVTAFGGGAVSVFFNYTNTGFVLLLCVTYLVLFRNQIKNSLLRRNYLLVTSLLLLYAVLLFQARTIYLQVFAMFMVFAYFGSIKLTRVLVLIMSGLGALAIVQLSGIEIRGRIGEVVSYDFIFKHLLTLFGSTEIEGAAHGVSQRLDWWSLLYTRWSASMNSILWGFGFGRPLIDFRLSDSVIAREPHNSLISITARLGLFGVGMFLWFHFQMLKSWYRGFRSAAAEQAIHWQNLYIFSFVLFLLVFVNSVGEDAFEKPFFAIPYYFFWGIILRASISKPWEQHFVNGSNAHTSRT